MTIQTTKPSLFAKALARDLLARGYVGDADLKVVARDSAHSSIFSAPDCVKKPPQACQSIKGTGGGIRAWRQT